MIPRDWRLRGFLLAVVSIGMCVSVARSADVHSPGSAVIGTAGPQVSPGSRVTAGVETLPYGTVLRSTAHVAPAIGRVRFSPDLQDAIPSIGADYPLSLGYTGTGSYVAVIDTGVEASHPFLTGKVALEACFSRHCPNGQTQMFGPGAAAPTHPHGTHVTGIVAGSNDTFHGVAPGAGIIAINIFDPTGNAYDDDMVRALGYVSSLADTYNIAAVNMSLGNNQIFGSTCDDYLPDLTAAVHELRMKNVATVVAAGNNYSLGMSSPACISEVVSVAATFSTAGVVADFSNVSQYTTLSAPGVGINSSKLSGSYGTSSGTSMAAPFVAGAFALHRQRFGVQTVDQVVTSLQTTATPALSDFTGIVTKRINLRALFGGNDAATSSTVAPSSTGPPTTVPATVAPEEVPTTTEVTQPPATTTTEAATTTSTTSTSPPLPVASTTTVSGSPDVSVIPADRPGPRVKVSATVRVNAPVSRARVAALARVTVPAKSRIILTVAPSSARFCRVVGDGLRGSRRGSCVVTVTVVRSAGLVSSRTIALVISP